MAGAIRGDALSKAEHIAKDWSAMEIAEEKTRLRARVRSAMAGISPAARAQLSLQAVERLRAQAAWKEAASVLMFAPLGDEVDIWPMVEEAIRAGKTVALPKYEAATAQYRARHVQNLAKEVKDGRFGIREPVEFCEALELKRLDLVLVPGVAFDPHGRRLGRGRGYYDRLLADVRGVRCGVAFDEQIVREVPVAPHDAQVNRILTPVRWLDCSRSLVLE